MLNNNNLKELGLTLKELTISGAETLAELLKNNHTLRVLDFSPKSSSMVTDTTSATIFTLWEKFPERCFLNKLNIGVKTRGFRVDFLQFLNKLLNNSPNLLKFQLQEQKGLYSERINSDLLKIFTSTSMEELILHESEVPSPTTKLLKNNKYQNFAKRKIALAEKLLALIAIYPNSANKLRTYAKKILQQSLAILPPSFRDGSDLKIRANLLLANIHLAFDDLPQAYRCYRECGNTPKAMLEIVMQLYGQGHEKFAFSLDKKEWLQFILSTLMLCDFSHSYINNLLPVVLESLMNDKKVFESTVLKDKFNATLPISCREITDIASRQISNHTNSTNEKITKQLQELQTVLGDERLSYSNTFNLLRVHPLVIQALKDQYNTAEVVCFEDLIINYAQPKTVGNPNDTWEKLYQDYQNGIFSQSQNNNDDLKNIKALSTKIFTFYDTLYLKKCPYDNELDSDTLKPLIELATRGHFPWLNNFIASCYVKLNNPDEAVKYYLKAATQEDFSDIKQIQYAAIELAAWAIKVLTSELYLTQYPQLTVFLGDCYEAHGRTADMLASYKIGLGRFPEIIINKVKQVVLRGNALALAFLQDIDPKPIDLLIFLGDFHRMTGNASRATDYYMVANPQNNVAALNGIQLLADQKGTDEAVNFMAKFYRDLSVQCPKDSKILSFAYSYNCKAARLNIDDAIKFLQQIVANFKLPASWLHAIAVIMEDHNQMPLAKDLFIRASESDKSDKTKKVPDPIIKLEAALYTKQVHFGDREKVLEQYNGLFCGSVLEAYFKSFPYKKSATQWNIAIIIAHYFRDNPLCKPEQALTWLRENAIAKNVHHEVKGEFARMLACAIQKLKCWKSEAVGNTPAVKFNKP